jgi:hypothetical protein
VRFELPGFAPVVHEDAIVPLGSVAVIDAAMQVADVDRGRQRDGADVERAGRADRAKQSHGA